MSLAGSGSDRRNVMDQTSPKFDTAEYEEALRGAGIDEKVARAHRTALVLVVDSATKDLTTTKDLQMLQTQFGAEMQKALNEFTWKILGGFVVVNALMLAIVKLT
jgi:hypothetical protein